MKGEIDVLIPESIIRFPNSMGITGECFANKDIIYSNRAERDGKFNADIDNISTISNVRNFMITCILGEGDRTAGIIQFMNKKGKKDINENDIIRMKTMQRFLGAMVENVTDLGETINITISVKGAIEGVMQKIKEEEEEVAQKMAKFSLLERHISTLNTIVNNLRV